MKIKKVINLKLFIQIIITTLLVGCINSRNLITDWSSLEYSNPESEIKITAGDVLEIKFAGTTLLDSTPMVRRDGKIGLIMKEKEDLDVAGKTLKEVENDLLDIYKEDLKIHEVDVTFVSSSAYVYVSGAVMQPGRVTMVRPLSVLEAIMEAGGYSPSQSKISKVKVIRYEQGNQLVFLINIENSIKGKDKRTFYLKPFDIIIVPEKKSSVFSSNG